MASDSPASSSRSSSPELPKIDKKLKRKHRETGKDAEEAPTVDETPNADLGSDDEDKPTADAAEEPEVPALSHAERRRQKKEAKLAAKAKEEEEAEEAAEGSAAVKKRKLKDGSAKKVDASNVKQRQNSVWAGNMSFKTQQEDLRRFFKDVGEITRINMPTKAPAGPGVRPENRGFAYIDFATPEAKAKAIALSEQPLVGRKLLIKDGDSFEGRPAATAAGELTLNDPALVQRTHSKTAQKILRSQKQPPASTLFLGNLGYETTEASIRQLLDAHRPGVKKGKDVVKDLPADTDVVDDKDASSEMDTAAEGEAESQKTKPKAKDDWIRQIRMGTFEDSGLCKGFAFVDFTSVEHATSALINPKNHHLDGRNLLVEYASPDAVRRGLNPFRPPGERSVANHGKKRPHRTERLQARAAMRPSATEDGASTNPNGEEAEENSDSRPKRAWEHKESTEGGARHKGPGSRPKPGAALALAKRESVAIVPSQGQKITF